MTPTFRRIAVATLMAATTGLAAGASAQSFPGGNINFIVPFPPGGGTDVGARVVLDAVSQATGWTFVVQNQPGAGGTIGMDQLSRATPDGLTIGMGQTSNLAINPALNPEVQYDPLADFTPITLTNTQPMGIIVFNDSPFADFGALVEAARAQPGGILFGTPGNGTVAHMSIERLMLQGGLELDHVPYTGIAQAISDVMGGVVDLYIGSLPSVLPHANAGSVRLIAVTSAEPDPLVPDVPTVASFGFDGYQSADWKAIVGPAGLAPEVVTALSRAITEALETPELQAALIAQGSSVMGGTPEEMATFMADEVKTWAAVVEAVRARPGN